MNKMMIVIAATVVALLASPVVAQTQADQGKAKRPAATTGSGATAPRLFSGPGVIKGNDVYDCTGKYLGTDPDTNIRYQILREGDKSCQGAGD